MIFHADAFKHILVAFDLNGPIRQFFRGGKIGALLQDRGAGRLLVGRPPGPQLGRNGDSGPGRGPLRNVQSPGRRRIAVLVGPANAERRFGTVRRQHFPPDIMGLDLLECNGVPFAYPFA